MNNQEIAKMNILKGIEAATVCKTVKEAIGNNPINKSELRDYPRGYTSEEWSSERYQRAFNSCGGF